MINNRKSLQEILSQVPQDYYASGVKSNLLQKYWHGKKWRELCKYIGIVNGKLLDVGCADGTTTKAIQGKYPALKIIGLDYYKDAINYAKKDEDKINFIVADAHKLPFKANFFDIVCAVEVLEHLTNPERVLSEINRVLKKGGYLIVVQDTDSLLFRTVWWFWTKWKGFVWNNSHISCVTPDVLLRRIKKQGFKIEKFRYTNLGMEIIIKAKKI